MISIPKRAYPVALIAGLAIAMIALAALAGCSSNIQSAHGDAGKIKVVASFYPMADFASKIGGDKVQVENLIPAGTEPHDWEPSTADVVDIGNSDVLVYNGAGMESWVDSVLASSDRKPVAVNASNGVQLREGGEEDESVAANGAQSHGTDPHVWLDPENAKIEMKNIADALSQVDPDNADYYQSNYQANAAQLDALDAQYRDELSKIKNKTLVVSHEAFGYLCAAYGLTQVGIEGLSADSEPDAARMAQIADFIKANGVTTVFFEDLVSPKVAEALASETGAQAVELNPLEGLSDDELASGADYFSVMRDNLATLTRALS